MYPNVKRQIPDFIEEYMVYCECFIDINKQKTCWVLTRNLKFFEFCQKQLVASIDLRTTCLNNLKNDLENYQGPKGKYYETSSVSPAMDKVEQNKISFGKYTFHAFNIYKIYVIIQCWDKCVILRRLHDFKGFEVKAEYENLLRYRIVHGTIKFCPVVEFKFRSEDILKTDFEDKLVTGAEEDDLPNKNAEMRQLLERIRCAKAELQLHKSITDRTFYTVQNKLVFGDPFLRTSKQEEKQILARCGDVWKRFTAHDDLVIGVPLVNLCSPPNLSIARNLKPVLQTNESLDSALQLHYRLFQLKLKFDQLDELDTFLESEDEELQQKIWCANGDLQLLPESFAVLLVKLKISQIISFKESPLILTYEVVRHLHTSSDTKNDVFTMPLQLYLQNLDFHRILFEERTHCEIKFLPYTLHQDLLTIAITCVATNLEIAFKSYKDLECFETFLQKRLDFSRPSSKSYSHADNLNLNSVLYNSTSSSLWFGSLILRFRKVVEDDNNQCLTTWKIYCQSFDKTLFLIKTFLNDHLTLECNIMSITGSDEQNMPHSVSKFENALRDELYQMQEIVRDDCSNSQQHLENLEKLCKLQMETDMIAKDILKN